MPSSIKLIILIGILIEHGICGSWPASKGMGFFQLTTKFVKADKYYTPAGDVAPIPTVKEFTNSLYGEFGLGKNFAIVINSGLYKHWLINERVKVNSVSNIVERIPGKIITGMGDSEFGIKVGLFKNPFWKFGSELSLGFPTSEFNKETVKTSFTPNPGDSLIDNTDPFPIPIGDDDFPISLKLSADLSLRETLLEIPMEISALAGFKNRNRGPGSKGYSDVVIYGGKLGFGWHRFYFIISGFGQYPLENGKMIKDTQYLSYGPQVYSRVTHHFGLVLGLESAAFNQNTLSALAYKGGLYFKL